MRTLTPWPAAGLVAVGTFCVGARAQPVVSAPVQVSTVPFSGLKNGEPVIVASTLDPNEVLVAWLHFPGLTRRVHYRVSTTGFLGPLPPGPLELPSPNSTEGACQPCGGPASGDPSVARSAAGHLYLGALFDGAGRSIGIARKPLDAHDLEGVPPIVRAIGPCLDGLDRPSMAAGPKPPDLLIEPHEALYFTYHVQGPGQPQPRPMYSARSLPTTPHGSAWQCTQTIPPSNNGSPALIASGSDPQQDRARDGVGNPSVVIQGGARAGRLIVASCSGDIATQTPPEITWTDAGGGPITASGNPWAAARMLDRYGTGNSEVAGIRNSAGQIPVGPDTLLQAQFQSAPSITTDPGNPSNVYAAFIGRSATDTPDRIDLFIAWTSTGNASQQAGGPIFQGQSFPADSLQRRTYRILDSWLVVPSDPALGSYHAEQFHPTLVIDALGGINLLFCQTFECVAGCESTTAPPLVTTRYARWPSRAALEAGQAPFLHVLATAAERWPSIYGHDYQGLTTSGCLAYAAWASKHTGEWHVYVSRIDLACGADADSSGIVDTNDPIAFGMQFAAQQPQADVNEDGLINPEDCTDFFNAYACGVCPVP